MEFPPLGGTHCHCCGGQSHRKIFADDFDTWKFARNSGHAFRRFFVQIGLGWCGCASRHAAAGRSFNVTLALSGGAVAPAEFALSASTSSPPELHACNVRLPVGKCLGKEVCHALFFRCLLAHLNFRVGCLLALRKLSRSFSIGTSKENSWKERR